MGDTWYLDELFVTIQGRQQYLWRAVDEDGDVIDILSLRKKRTAACLFRRQATKNLKKRSKHCSGISSCM